MPIAIVIIVLVVFVYWYNRRAMRSRAQPASTTHPSTPSVPLQDPEDDNEDVDEFELVGESNYQDALIKLFGPYTQDGLDARCPAVLIPEPSNMHDKNAVRCEISGLVVGYLVRDEAADISKAMKRQRKATLSINANIRGGWSRGRQDQGMYGVTVEIPLTLTE